MDMAWNNLSDAIFEYATSRPNAPALIQGGETITYGALADLVGRAAVQAHDLGVRPGDVVAVALPSTIEHVILTFALLRLGAVPLDLPAERPLGALVDPIVHFKVGRAFLTPEARGYDGAIVHRVGPEWRAGLAAKAGDRRTARDQDAMHFLHLTSGSTGVPKGIATSQSQWIGRFQTALRLFPDVLARERPAKLMLVGGMGFSAFFFFLANQICVGGPTVLMAEDHRPEVVARNIQAWEDGAVMITPPLLRQFLAAAPQEGLLFPRLRALFIGASPLFPEEKRAVVGRLTPNLYEVYGSAAVGFISVLAPGDVAGRMETVGRISPGLTVEAADGADQALPPGMIGHLRCRGPGVSGGLYGDASGAAAAAEGFRDGWYYPGDIGTLSADGFITLKGRVADLMRRRGVDIYMPEIEQAMQAHESVLEAAAAGVPGPDGGEARLEVFVVPRGAPQTPALEEHCRRQIPAEKFPDRVFFVRGLPKTPNGKVDRRALVAMAVRARQQAAEQAGGPPTTTNS